MKQFNGQKLRAIGLLISLTLTNLSCASQQTLAQQNSLSDSQEIEVCPRQFTGWSLVESYETNNYSLALCQQGEQRYLVGHLKYQHEGWIAASVVEKTEDKLQAEDEYGFSYELARGQLTVIKEGKVVAQEILFDPTSESREEYTQLDLSQLPVDVSLRGTHPQEIALAIFGNQEPREGNFQETVTVQYPREDRALVILTQIGLLDDSIKGFRYRLEFEKERPSGKSQWRLVWAGRQQTCWPGRGSQDWTTEPCF